MSDLRFEARLMAVQSMVVAETFYFTNGDNRVRAATLRTWRQAEQVLLWEALGALAEREDGLQLLAPERGCPECGEVDPRQVWLFAASKAECQTCGKAYSPGAPETEDLVDSAFACPECGERRPDQLANQEDGSVLCAKCWTQYSIN